MSTKGGSASEDREGCVEMSIFEYRKPPVSQAPKDALTTLRATLARLEASEEQTPRVAELRRILAVRIAEIERKTA